VPISVPKKIVFAVLTVAGFLMVLNGLFSLKERIQFGGTFEQKEAIYQTTDDGRRTLRPGSELQGMSTQVKINKMGFRGPDPLEPKPENSFRIWCVGGSTTFDVWAPDDASTWPAKLQAYLQEAKPDRTIEVINAGIPGEMMNGSRDDFEEHFENTQPDAMVFYHGPNDIRGIAFNGPPPVIEGLDEQFAIVRSVRGAVQRKLPRVPPEWNSHRLKNHHFGILEATVLQLINAARQRGVEVMVVSHALQAANVATGDEALHGTSEVTAQWQMSPEGVLHTFKDFNQILRATAEREKLPFADLRARIPSDDRYWGDSLHFSATGSDIAGRFLADAFLQTDWL
jgi:lysophospholipase L1-like esterase